MKIVLFARTLGSTQLCKISQEFGLLSNFGNLPKIRNAQFGRLHPLGVKLQPIGLASEQKFEERITGALVPPDSKQI